MIKVTTTFTMEAAFVKELENLIKNFEYTFDLEGSQIFPNNNIKQDIVSEYRSI